MLKSLNDAISEVSLNLSREPQRPVVFIIGAARTGTTLVSQLLNVSGQFGSISNLAALFYNSPAIGCMVERIIGEKFCLSRGNRFENDYGQTEGLLNTHEFGYFWNRFFDIGGETHNLSAKQLSLVNSDLLKQEVGNMEAVLEAPVVFKNNTWCTMQASFLANLFPTAIFVVCRRAPVFSAQSHIFGRDKKNTSRAEWWSIKPSTYSSLKKLSIWQQVAGQVVDIEREMDLELEKIPLERIVNAAYSDVCENPESILNNVVGAANKMGENLSLPAGLPTSFKSSDKQRLPDADWWKLCEAVGYMSQTSRH